MGAASLAREAAPERPPAWVPPLTIGTAPPAPAGIVVPLPPERTPPLCNPGLPPLARVPPPAELPPLLPPPMLPPLLPPLLAAADVISSAMIVTMASILVSLLNFIFASYTRQKRKKLTNYIVKS
uniref:Uncharacterized protein n=1 Tax=Populus davidiana TaxID=266767 RepID=A0A6M2E9S8_9ROSI